jgi:membrane-bound ClpP family serine protease
MGKARSQHLGSAIRTPTGGTGRWWSRLGLLVACWGLLISLAVSHPHSAAALVDSPQAAPAPGQAKMPPASVVAQGPLSVPAGRQAKNIAVITIFGEINATTAQSVQRRIDLAVKAGANAIVFQLDTPGGEIGAVLDICTAIKRCGVANTVAWVNPTAYSGGAIIALACREMVIAKGATMGDALPIMVSFGMLNKLPEHERQKLVAPLLAEVVDSARLRGYDEKLVQGLVTLGVELWLVERVNNPGEVLFVDREEYRTIFGQEPGPATPRLVGSQRRPPEAGAASPASGKDASSPAKGEDAPAGSATSASKPPTSPGEPPARGTTPEYVPAAPRLNAVANDVDMGLRAMGSTPPRRPTLGERDRGQWRLVERVSDGLGVFTFKQGELFDFRLAKTASTSDGTVNTDDELKAFFGGVNLVRLDQTWSEGLVRFLTNQIVRVLLIVVFLLGLFVELTHPGLVFPACVAMTALFALIAPPLLIGMAEWWTLAAIGGGVVLLILEILVLPGFGVPGLLGLLLLFAGLVGAISPGATALFPDSPGESGGVLHAVTTVSVSACVALVGMYFAGKHLGRLPILNRLVLQGHGESDEGGGVLAAMVEDPAGPVRVGEVGQAVTPLRPAGRVQVGEQIIDVVADIGYIASGERVRVTGVSSFRITVERVGGPSAAEAQG